MASESSLERKVCVVTGANGAMGRVTTAELARRGATVVMVCRNQAAGEAARAEIAAATGNERLELVIADLSSQQEVRDAAAEITGRHPQLHVLVNNAGVSLAHRQETPDGIEKTFATNYLSPFLLTHLLLDALKAGAPSRIVNVASKVTNRYSIDLDDLAQKRKYSTFSAGSQSKLALMMFTVELARRLDGTGVTVNALHPGFVKSGLTRDLSPMMRTLLNLMSTTPEKGARTAIYLATSPEVEGVSGQFFAKRKPAKLNAQALDQDARRRLWEQSLVLTGLEQT